MPYTVENPPEAIKDLPKHAIEIWVSAYNSAFKQYEGNEGKAAGTAWAAVKMKYKKDEKTGKWVAKESKGVTMAKTKVKESELSAEDTRRLLQGALEQEFPASQPMLSGAWIRDIYDEKLVYERGGQTYEVSYTITDGAVTFGKPIKVMSKTIYEPIESLRSKYTEIIQEVGKRNAKLDSTRIKKIVELCQELLSSEEPEEEKTKETIKEADKVLAWLKEQAAMKTEEGEKYPAEAFAFVPDKDKPSEWKLRLWEDPTKKVTRAQLGRAAAALSPGGFRGQKVAIPSADLPAVKRKIRAEYRKLDVEDEDIPKWVKEIETRELILDYIPLTEAKFEKGRATVVVIKPGFNASEDRYYPAEVLKRDYKIFEGMKMYADHPTEEEDKSRPERSIRDWVATLTEVTCDESGTITGIAELVEPWLMQKLASLRDKDMLSEMGISINAIGNASKDTIDGKETLVIEKLVACRSVDFVTEPGAGGVVTFYEADRRRDIDLVELATLRERRPDLIKAIEANVRVEIQKEVKHKMELEERITELEGQIATLTTERDALKEAAEKAEKAKAKAEVAIKVAEALKETNLPETAKKRIEAMFAEATTDEGLAEAIKAEVDYVASILESGKVKGLGGSQPNSEKDREALKESFKRMHPEYSEEQLRIAVEGK